MNRPPKFQIIVLGFSAEGVLGVGRLLPRHLPVRVVPMVLARAAPGCHYRHNRGWGWIGRS
jgi:hypothetical protein